MFSLILSMFMLLMMTWFSSYPIGLILPVMVTGLELVLWRLGSDGVFIGLFLLEDKLSLILVAVSMWVSVSMVSLRNASKYSYLIVLLLISSVCFFTVSSWLMFFVFFEFSLLPIFLVLTFDGEQPERIRAGRYMMLYTVIISIPFLLSVVSLNNSGVCWIYDSQYLLGHVSHSSLFFFCLVGGFLVKVPLFWLHSWLPKAHVESPIWGSIFLAGVLLKFGAYGLIRSLFITLPDLWLMSVILSFGLLGACYSAGLAFLSSDVKVIVAYSSVSHMNACVVGLMMLKQFSWKSVVLVSVAHSLSASILFYMVTMIYALVGSRSLFICKSIVSLYPGMVMFCFLAWSLNVGVPPTLGFLGEFCTVLVVTGVWWFLSLGLLLSIFVNSGYSMIVFGCLSHGLKSWFKKSLSTYSVYSMLTTCWLLVPQMMLFLFSSVVNL
uniref:NADH-ubiquinone oxidoreductase chain 4 n=1 Tax=Haematopinus asini TaxID=1461129 RepID=A0A059TD28_9NEOP|nr:NADH dehydrogenase subunit 4 [Haematopinus asini]AHY04289.1 NADH dehydrogenase subunit 4 [Haematopinus asini]